MNAMKNGNSEETVEKLNNSDEGKRKESYPTQTQCKRQRATGGKDAEEILNLVFIIFPKQWCA